MELNEWKNIYINIYTYIVFLASSNILKLHNIELACSNIPCFSLAAWIDHMSLKYTIMHNVTFQAT